jgi:hypothetical protein
MQLQWLTFGQGKPICLTEEKWHLDTAISKPHPVIQNIPTATPVIYVL